MNENILEIYNVCKQYNDETILDNINLSVGKGEIIGIIGKNGCGKSTLLKCIAGLSYPNSGNIMINGKSYKKGCLGEVSPDLGILIESPKFLPDFSGLNNLLMLAQIRNIIDKKTIADLMTLFQLDPNNKKKFCKYSLGMKQKLGIIQAIMENPQLILFDEPTNALDEAATKIFLKKVKEMSQNGTSFIIVSHLKDDLENLCDKFYKLDNHHLNEYKKGNE